MRKISHIAIAVPSIEKAAQSYKRILGISAGDPEIIREQGVRVAEMEVGDTRLELLEPLGPDTPVGRFLLKRGPGLHHIAIEVEDLAARVEALRAQGVRLIDEQPRVGAGGHRIAFIHPDSAGGVLIELCEKEMDR